MNDRVRLPNRRKSEVRDFEHHGMKFSVCVGYYEDGRIGEIFLQSDKAGSEIEAMAKDAAICMSLAIQLGASLDDLRHALQKDFDSSPATLLGAALTELRFIHLEGPQAA